MLRVTRDQYFYEFRADATPVGRIKPGDRVVFETYDASTGRMHKPDDVHNYLKVRDLRRVNPAAGPIFVEGAKPGDELVVTIEDIKLEPQGYIRAMPNNVLRDGIDPVLVHMVPVKDGNLHLPGGLVLPARPMVGVIGTAPAEGILYTANPGPEGSNLDVRLITTGARVHLPVRVDGALFGLGDIHASMGDGEVTGLGVEINGEVTVKVDLLPGQAHARVWLENDEVFVSTGNAPQLAEAVTIAVEGMTTLLRERLPVSKSEAFILVSARGDVTIGQCCGGLDCTVYVKFPHVGKLAAR